MAYAVTTAPGLRDAGFYFGFPVTVILMTHAWLRNPMWSLSLRAPLPVSRFLDTPLDRI
jgi:hypothetical protein